MSAYANQLSECSKAVILERHHTRVNELLAANNALLARARKAEELTNWQPIETAPKDRVIDLWAIREVGGKSRRYADCYWGRATFGSEPCGPEKWCGFDEQYSAVTPTHWRETPAEPKKET